MRVLLTGASGFIGRHLHAALRRSGHTVVCAMRAPAPPFMATCDEVVPADFARDFSAAAWLPRLRGIDAVINSVGILREQGSQTFRSLHVQAPSALFDACVQADVRRVINISALGADEHARSAYHLSKRRADEHLASLALSWTIVQPSLVYGPGGASARLFDALASAPLIPLPDGGTQLVQPIHIDDLVAGITEALANASTHKQVVPFVGPAAISMREYLALLRHSMNLGAAHIISIPTPLVRLIGRVSARLPGAFLDADTLGMLERGSIGDAGAITHLLHRRPRSPDQFIAPGEAGATRKIAQLSWLLPMLRVSIAFVWIATAIVSLGLFPSSSSYALLLRVGVPAALAPLFLYGAAALDLALGLATLLMRRRRALWLAQMALILSYTLIITLRMPEFWLHPYGPLLKNLPMLAAILTLHTLERR